LNCVQGIHEGKYLGLLINQDSQEFFYGIPVYQNSLEYLVNSLKSMIFYKRIPKKFQKNSIVFRNLINYVPFKKADGNPFKIEAWLLVRLYLKYRLAIRL
jgi:hypothetical protein